MQQISSNYKNEIKQPSRHFECRVTIGKNIYTNESIVDIILDYPQAIDGFSIGNTTSQSLDLTLLNTGEEIYSTNQIKVEIGLQVGSDFEYILMGYYNVDEVSKNDYTIKFTAFDNMMKFETPYFSSLGDKPTLQQVVNELATITGVSFVGSIPSYTVTKLEGYTCREVLSYVASLCGGNALVTRDGKFTIKTLQVVDCSVTTENHFGLTTEEVPYKLGKITCLVDEENEVSKGATGTDSMELSFENPWMTESILNTLYRQLNGFSYLGFQAKWQGDLSLDPYDLISIQDKKGTSYKVPILNQKFIYVGGLTSEIAAKGESKNKNSFSSSGPTANKTNRLVTEQAIIKEALINKASIQDLEAVSIRTQTLEATTAKIQDAIIDVAHISDLNAVNAKIESLQATDVTIQNAIINKADISELNAAVANINILNADLGVIKHLVNGNLSSENIQAGGITSDKLTIANGFIKDAMIDSLNANKITAGQINTALVQVSSASGNLVINDNTIQIRDANRVRVQIGKDASNDYSMSVWDSNGKLMFDARGLKANAIKDSIIRNDMISAEANIDGTKLNISSVVSSINNSSSTLRASKVQFDGIAQTLEVAFNALKTQADATKTQTESNTTAISVAQGQIKTLIQDTTITKDGVTTTLKDEYSRLEQTVSGLNSVIGKQQTIIDDHSGKITSTNSELSTLKQSVNGLSASISSAQTTINSHTTLINQKADLTAVNDKINSAKNELNTSINKKANAVDVYNKTDVYTRTETDSKIQIAKDAINLGVSQTYETKTNVESKINGIQIGGRNYFLNSNFTKTTTMSSGTNKNPNVYPSDWGGYNGGITNPTTNYHAHIDNDTFGYNVVEYNESDGTRHWKGITQGSLQNRIKNVGEFTISMDVYATATGTKTWGGFYYTKVGGTTNGFHSGSFRINSDKISVGKWTRVTAKVPMNSDVDFNKSISFYIYGYDFTSNAILYIKNVTLSQGTNGADWTPAPEDVKTSITNAESNAVTTSKSYTDSQIKLTKESIELGVSQTYETKTNVSSQISSTLTSAKSYADTKKSEAISSASSDATTKANNALNNAKSYADTKKQEAITSANNTLNSTIANYYTKSQTDSAINVAKEAINLGVSNTYETKTNVTTKVNQAVVDSRKIPDTRNDNQNPQWYMTNYPKQTITEFKSATTMGLSNVGGFGAVTTVVPWSDSSGGYPVQTWRSNTNNATYERRGTSGTAWGSWRQIEDSASSQAKANTAKNDAITSANNTLNTTIANYYTKTQTDSQINVAKNAITQSVANTYETKTESTTKYDTATAIAKAMNEGKMLYTDTAFRTGGNNVNLYNNAGNGNVVVERIAKPSDCPTTSTHCIRITHKGAASPNLGGFYQSIQSRANAIFIQKFVAKLPSGYTLNTASNSMGNGYTDKWLTSNKGTGKWETYIRQVVCGSTGTFSTGGHVHVSGATPTASAPLVWYLASCTAIDITDTDERISSLTTRMSSAESKITDTAITNTVKQNFYTKTETNNQITSKGYQTASQVQQTVDNLQIKFTQSGGYNLIRNGSFENGNTYWVRNGSFTDGRDQWSPYGSGTSWVLWLNKAWSGLYQRFNCRIGQTYSWSMDIYVEKGTCACGIENVNQEWWEKTNGWQRMTGTFVAKNSSHVFTLYTPKDGETTIHVDNIMVCEGSIPSAYTPHPSEIYDGITQIDKDGIKVSTSKGAYTRFSADGMNSFNNSGVQTLGIRNGGLTIHNGGEYVGFISQSQMTNSGLNGISIANSKQGEYIAFGWDNNATDPNAGFNHTHILTIYKDNYSGINGTKGVNIFDTLNMQDKNITNVWTHYINGSLRMKDNATLLFDSTATYPSAIWEDTSSGNLAVFGDNGVVLGYKNGNTNTNMFKITETADGKGCKINSYQHWNFNDWTMHNMQATYNGFSRTGADYVKMFKSSSSSESNFCVELANDYVTYFNIQANNYADGGKYIARFHYWNGTSASSQGIHFYRALNMHGYNITNVGNMNVFALATEEVVANDIKIVSPYAVASRNGEVESLSVVKSTDDVTEHNDSVTIINGRAEVYLPIGLAHMGYLVHVTPNKLVKVAVTEKLDDYFVIEVDSDEDVVVDYCIKAFQPNYATRVATYGELQGEESPQAITAEEAGVCDEECYYNEIATLNYVGGDSLTVE